MKLAVVGSRDFDDYALLRDSVLTNFDLEDLVIISGGARGADNLAKTFALSYDIPFLEFKADWASYGKSAGYKRNKQIVDSCDLLIAFWDRKSKGTQISIDLADKQDKLFKVVYF